MCPGGNTGVNHSCLWSSGSGSVTGHQAALTPGLRLRMRPLGFVAQALLPVSCNSKAPRPQRVPGGNGSPLPIATTSPWTHSSSASLHSRGGLSPPLLWILPGVPSLMNQHIPGDGFPDEQLTASLYPRSCLSGPRDPDVAQTPAQLWLGRCFLGVIHIYDRQTLSKENHPPEYG